MEKIITNQFKLSKSQYFLILLAKYFKRRIWFYLFLWVVTFFITLININIVTLILIAYAVLYPLFICFFILWKANKANEVIFRERTIELSNKTLKVIIPNTNISEFKIDEFEEIRVYKKFIIAYLSKNQYIYIPISAFSNKNQFQKFLKLMSKK